MNKKYEINSLKCNEEEITLFDSDLFCYKYEEDSDIEVCLLAVLTVDAARKLDEDSDLEFEITLRNNSSLKLKGELHQFDYYSPIVNIYLDSASMPDDEDITLYETANWKENHPDREAREKRFGDRSAMLSLINYPPHKEIDVDNIKVQENHMDWLEKQGNTKEIVEKALKEYITKQMYN